MEFNKINDREIDVTAGVKRRYDKDGLIRDIARLEKELVDLKLILEELNK